MASKRILLTGHAGAIGRRLGPALRARGHFVRGLDMQAGPADVCDEALAGELNDPDILARACAGMDTLIHLAATPDEADFLTQLLPNNITGSYRLLEAAQRAGVGRAVLASSVQVAQGYKGDRSAHHLDVMESSAPTNFYGCTKLLLEGMGRVFAHRHKMTVVAVRIGWFIRNETELAKVREYAAGKPLAAYLSHDDARRFFTCAVEANMSPGSFTLLWAMSRQPETRGYDLAPARDQIGYQPQDVFPEGMDLGNG